MPGPPPKLNAERRRRNAPRANTVKLPGQGRAGPIPAWPMQTSKPEEWDQLWRLPQAVMWEGMGAEPIVARYVDLRDKVMDPSFPEGKNASFWNVLMALEDRLGLTPTAMMKLQWEIDSTGYEANQDAGPVEEGSGNAAVLELRKRAAGATE